MSRQALMMTVLLAFAIAGVSEAAAVSFWFAETGDAGGTAIFDKAVAPGANFTVSIWYQTSASWPHNGMELLVGYDQSASAGTGAIPLLNNISATAPAASSIATVWRYVPANNLGGGSGSGNRPYGAHLALWTDLGSGYDRTGVVPAKICDVTLKNNMPSGCFQTVTLWNDQGFSSGWTCFLTKNLSALQSATAAVLTVHSGQSVTPMSTSQVKTQGNGLEVYCEDKTVTAVFGDSFYMEDPDRSSGIRVLKPGHGRSLGDAVSVEGTMATDANGERYVDAGAGTVTGSAGIELSPLGMTNRAVGGADFGSVVTRNGQQGVAGGTGANNIGLLVKTTGRATAGDANGFTLSDGSGVPVTVTFPGGGTAFSNRYVTVIGISSIDSGGNRVVKARAACDITTTP